MLSTTDRSKTDWRCDLPLAVRDRVMQEKWGQLRIIPSKELSRGNSTNRER